jgi:hypothetical protein
MTFTDDKAEMNGYVCLGDCRKTVTDSCFSENLVNQHLQGYSPSLDTILSQFHPPLPLNLTTYLYNMYLNIIPPPPAFLYYLIIAIYPANRGILDFTMPV